MKTPARPDYLRPCNPDGTAISTHSVAANHVKYSAITTLMVFLEQIADSHAYDGALVNIDVDLGMLTFDNNEVPSYGMGWTWFGVLTVYILFLHLVVFYFVGGRGVFFRRAS